MWLCGSGCHLNATFTEWDFFFIYLSHLFKLNFILFTMKQTTNVLQVRQSLQLLAQCNLCEHFGGWQIWTFFNTEIKSDFLQTEKSKDIGIPLWLWHQLNTIWVDLRTIYLCDYNWMLCEFIYACDDGVKCWKQHCLGKTKWLGVGNAKEMLNGCCFL